MAFASNISLLTVRAQSAITSLGESVKGLLGYGHYNDFSPEEVLLKTPNIDPRFIAQAPMSNANLDVHTLQQLGSIGLKRGKEITAQSHPELYAAFAQMSARAGLKHPPQLILAESKTVNALTISPQEVCVTTGLLKLLNLREVNAVLGHELGHGSSDHTTPRIIATGVFAGIGAMLGDRLAYRGGPGSLIKHDVPNPSRLRQIATRVFGRGDRPLSWIDSAFSIAIGVGLGSIVANQVSVRPTELDADRKGAMISGDPEGLISALSKLESTRKSGPIGSFFAHLRSGYPSTETRIRHLRGVPQTMPAGTESVPVAQIEAVPVAGVSPTALITGAALAERVGTPVAPAHAQG